MAITRRQVRQAMIDWRWIGGFHGTASAGDGASIAAVALTVGGEPTSKFAGHWPHRPDASNVADYYRRVRGDGYSGREGRILHAGPGYTEAPLAGSDSGYFELLRYDPRFVNQAISNALTTRCHVLNKDDIVTTGVDVYTLGTAPWPSSGLTDADQQILEIEQVLGTDPNDTVVPWGKDGRDWWGDIDGTLRRIRFDPAPTGTLRAYWREPAADLTDDTTTVERELAYAKWASFYELFLMLAAAARDRGERTRHYEDLAHEAYTSYWGERLYAMTERFAGEVIVRQDRTRFHTTTPVMGRP